MAGAELLRLVMQTTLLRPVGVAIAQEFLKLDNQEIYFVLLARTAAMRQAWYSITLAEMQNMSSMDLANKINHYCGSGVCVNLQLQMAADFAKFAGDVKTASGV